MAALRSFLFVPASRVVRFEKSLDTESDAIIIDLGDSVASDAKDTARDDLCDWLEEQEKDIEAVLKRIWVRINPLNSPWGQDDIDELATFNLGGWVLPKAESTYDIEQVVNLKPKRTQLALLIETDAGLEHARLLSAIEGVKHLLIGAIEF